MSVLINDIPVIALRDVCVLPAMKVQFEISREKSVKAWRTVMETDKFTAVEKGGNRRIFLVMQKDPHKEDPKAEDLCRTGIVAKITSSQKVTEGVYRLNVIGMSAAQICELYDGEYLHADISMLAAPKADMLDEVQAEAMKKALHEIFLAFCQEGHAVSRDQMDSIFGEGTLEQTVHRLCRDLPLPAQERQKFLDAESFEELFSALCLLLRKETEVLRIKNGVAHKVRQQIDKNQRDYVLREELKVIRKELGEDGPETDADTYTEKLEALDADETVKEHIRREIGRLKTLGNSSAEAAVSRTYIETLLDMPWNKRSEDNLDLINARKVLDEDHYGLEKVKERVLEYLAVRSLNKSGDTPILCLVGPPGTGKTSIARSVAKAVNRNYVRISLGGVRDEAEIRGHRRTYIGALPGRIASSLKKSGVGNPLMLLDEIDKVGSDYKGDTAAALLEVLDSEQNVHFADHYIEIPVDLSEVMFIATANDMNKIPQPLADRMEIIEVTSYTENEKFHIAKEHLVEKQIAHNGLEKKQLKISPKALEKIISGYTREAGVRSLERMIGRVCRKAAKAIVEGQTTCVNVKASDLKEYLGNPRYKTDETDHEDLIGIAHGLAWTSVGGVTLEIEVNVMPGKGSLTLTGQMGDVMKESAQAGISYIRSMSETFGIAPDYFEKHDVHVHIPEGAVPKDGPSAGITMATAILSAVTGRAVSGEIAMTGEITLRGRVLPIGGLKEKLLAAGKAGFKTVLVPKANKADVSEIDEEITGPLEIIFVSQMKDVLERALR